MKDVVNEINVNVERRISGVAPEDMDNITIKLHTMGEKGLPFAVVVRDKADQEEPSFESGFPDVVRLWMPSKWAGATAEALEEAARQLRRLHNKA